MVARLAHNQEVVGSNPAPATIYHVEISGHGLISVSNNVKGMRFSQRPALLYSSLCMRVIHAGASPPEREDPVLLARGIWECQSRMQRCACMSFGPRLTV